MRAGTLLITFAVLASACASSQSVEVSSSDQLRTATPSATDAADSSTVELPRTTPTTTTTVADAVAEVEAEVEAAIEAVDPGNDAVRAGWSPYLLTDDDLPDWDLLGPFEVPNDPVWVADDCIDMATAWDATGRAGVRTRGSNGDTAFRNTAVDFESGADASSVIEAVERVAYDCVQFDSSGTTFWSEPLEMPASLHPSAGIVIGSSSINTWILAFWQVDNTVVSLEVEGDDVWSNIDELVTTLDNRLIWTELPTISEPVDVSPGTEPVIDEPDVVTTTEPDDEPAVVDLVAEEDEEWEAHELAPLIPTAADIGDEWEYDYGSVIDAAPADDGESIPGCDVAPPPTLPGIDASFSAGLDSLEITVAEGDPADAQQMIDALRGVTECELSEQDVGVAGFDLVDRSIENADDSVFITAGVSTGFADTGTHLALGIARYDGLLIGAFIAVERSTSSDESFELIARLIEQMASNR